MELDRHKLLEERRWRLRNYSAQVQRLVSTLVDAIQTEARRTLEQEIVYADDLRNEFTYVEQAGQLQHAIIQAVNNADFGGLTRDAGDLHAVEMALRTLSKLKETLPSVVRAELEAAEDDRLRARLDEKLARIDELEAHDRDDCVAAVHEGGRGVGFHRCTRKGKHTVTVDKRPGYGGKLVADDDPHAMKVKLCGTHAREAEQRGQIHVYRPSEWDEKQRLGWREKERREIVAMRRQLGELVEGDEQKMIANPKEEGNAG